jgi:hypothetical protein
MAREDDEEQHGVIDMQVSIPPEGDKMRVGFTYDLSVLNEQDDINYWYSVIMGMRYMLLLQPHKLVELAQLAGGFEDLHETNFGQPEAEDRRVH